MQVTTGRPRKCQQVLYGILRLPCRVWLYWAHRAAGFCISDIGNTCLLAETRWLVYAYAMEKGTQEVADSALETAIAIFEAQSSTLALNNGDASVRC